VAFLAVVDACALYPFALRDTLLRLAELELYDVQWSERILEEMRANLLENYGATDEQADRVVAEMTGAFAGAAVPADAIAELEPAMTNDEKDRHVLAAAVASGSEVVVTFNLTDFPEEALGPLGIEAVHPDDFLQTLLAIDEPAVLGALEQQAADLVNPPLTFDELLEALERAAPGFVAAVRRAIERHNGE
jgi:predicted nucleic acid-binding protein